MRITFGVGETPRRASCFFVCALVARLFNFALQATVPLPEDTTNLLSSWSFTDTTNWLNSFDYAPVSFTNLNSSPLGNGDALVVDHTNAAWLQYNVHENDGFTNLTVDRGTVMFWFAPAWSGTNEGGSGPGQWGRLIEAGSYTTNASYGWWSLYVDPEGVNLYFSAQTNNGSGATWLSAPIAWTTNRWHHLALTYSATNSALYLDGTLATNGWPATNWPGADVLTNGFLLGSDGDTGLAQARGMFDDLSTYNVPLDAGTIAGTYLAQSMIYLLNPGNLANISSAESEPLFDPGFRAITGAGDLQWVGTSSDCATNENIWLTNVMANVTGVTFTIAGGSNNVPYDVFATAGFEFPQTNTVWAWMGQGYHCNRYSLANLPPAGAFLILGTAKNSDGDGLTDAYERLVSKTDPNDSDSDGDGVMDGWEVVFRTDPKNQDSDADGVIDQAFAIVVTRPTPASALP
jgi:hypothetical protein